MSCIGDSILTSNETYNDTGDNRGTTQVRTTQGFKIPNDAVVCGASFFGGKGLSSGTFSANIKSGSITGTVLATTGSIDNSTLPVYTSGAWNKFEFSSTVALTGGTQYYFTLEYLTGSTNDILRPARQTGGSVYAEGMWGNNTTEFSTVDLAFRIHGVESSGAGSINAFLCFPQL